MKIIEVKDKRTNKQFYDIARSLYKNDDTWVCPLDAEIEGMLNITNPKQKEIITTCKWILVNDQSETIGRIAAFINKNKAYKHSQPSGGAGFFECINDQQAANMLFDTAKEWLAARGMEAMDAPVNPGENIVYWGLLVRGFTHQGYGMPYNHSYYKELFENYGFQNYFEQYSYHYDLSVPFPERHVKFSDHIASKPNYTFEHFKFKDKEKYLNDVVYIYNEVWSDFHEDYTPLTYEDMLIMFEDAKPILNEEFVWFAYDEGKPVAMVIVFPDANQILKKLNGRLHFWNKLRFLYYKKTKIITRARQLITGAIPSHQRTGIIGPLFLTMADALKKHGIKELELSWVGDYNFTVTKMYSQFGAKEAKTHVTYRYLFDRNKPFQRFTNEQSEKAKRFSQKEHA